MARTKRPANAKEVNKPLSTQVLKVFKSEVDSEKADPKFERLKKVIFTQKYIDSVPEQLEKLKENGQIDKYLYYLGNFWKMIDDHDGRVDKRKFDNERLKLLQAKLKQDERRLKLDELRVRKIYDNPEANENGMPLSYDNAVLQLSEIEQLQDEMKENK